MMKRLSRLLLLFLLFAMVSGAWAGPEEEVAELHQQWRKAFNDGNLDALVALYAENGVQTGPTVALRAEGREAIRAHFKGVFSRLVTRMLVPEQVSIRVYNDTTAVVNEYEQITATNPAGQTVKVRNRASTTWVKLAAKWQIVDKHSSQVVRPPAP